MAESALATFVVFLFRCFTELMRLILDAVCLTMLLCVCLMPWRWPFLSKLFDGLLAERKEFESKSAEHFFLGIGDALCYLLLLVPLCSGLQTVQTCKRLGKVDSDNWGDGTWYEKVFVSLGYLIYDIFLIIGWSLTLTVALLVLCTVLRAVKLCQKLGRSEVREGWESDDGGGACLPVNGKLMSAVWGQAGQLVLDIAFVPLFLIVFCSGWRTAILLRKVRDAKGMKKRQKVFKQFGALLADLPCVLAGCVVVVTGWRARLLVRELRKAKDVDEAREAAIEQLTLLVRDLPCFGLFVLLAATLYRLPGTLLKCAAPPAARRTPHTARPAPHPSSLPPPLPCAGCAPRPRRPCSTPPPTRRG